MKGRVITDERIEIRIWEVEIMQDISEYSADFRLSKRRLRE